MTISITYHSNTCLIDGLFVLLIQCLFRPFVLFLLTVHCLFIVVWFRLIFECHFSCTISFKHLHKYLHMNGLIYICFGYLWICVGMWPNMKNMLKFDIGRYGIQFLAYSVATEFVGCCIFSPRLLSFKTNDNNMMNYRHVCCPLWVLRRWIFSTRN